MSCLGPGLWNIFYNSLLNLEFKSSTKIIAFADDHLLLTRGMSVSYLENIANIKLKLFQRWQEKIKTVLTTKIANKKKNVRRKRLGNICKQKSSPTNKYREIPVYNKRQELIFRENITQATEECRKIIFALSRSAKINWELGHKALKTLYTEGIRPLLLYGAPVWAEILDKKVTEIIKQNKKSNEPKDSESLENGFKISTMQIHRI